jgi:uncharacterized protein
MEEIFDKIRKYNVWDGQEIHIGFERKAYLEKIRGYIGNKLVKVLVGQRRAGKSYILRQIMNFLIKTRDVQPGNIFYLNKEFTAFDAIRTSSDLETLYNYYRSKLKVEGKIYIFLDEIQSVNEWEVFVNSYSQDFTNDYELFVTGSNSNLLSGELATLLSGRYIEFEILPFSFLEYAEFEGKAPERVTFFEYLQTGGLPELFHLEDEEIKRHYVESLKNTIILRDIAGRRNIKDLTLLEDIFKFLTVNIGNLTSFSSIVNYFKNRQKKTNYETISAYTGFLTDSFLIHHADRYNLRGKQVLGAECKYYLNDLSFKNFLFGFFPSDSGYNLENFVYIQLRRMGFKVNVGVINGLEIDFVAQKPEKTMYIQVCFLLNSPEVISREFGNLLLIRDNHEKIVISLDEMRFSDYEGIKHLRPWELI